MPAIAERIEAFGHGVLARYARLNRAGRIALGIYVLSNLAVTVLIIVIGPHAAFDWLASLAEDLGDRPYGWAILLSALIVTSIPPLYGYSTAVSLCGFVYANDLLTGWAIAASGCVLGSCLAFLVARGFATSLLESEPAFGAFAGAVQSKGLPLIVLLRFCPLPFSLSNAAFALMNVSLRDFVIATAAITPKLAIHVYIGSRLFLFADPESRGRMDGTTRLINVVYIVIASLISLATSIYVIAGEDQPLSLDDPLLEDAAEDDAHSTSDVDDIERQLVADGHIDRPAPVDRPRPSPQPRESLDQWGRLSDFDDEREAWADDDPSRPAAPDAR